jgi:endonuclease III
VQHFCDEPWKLLVACVLMMRVSSHDTKTSCIEGFFDLCPTPTAFLDAEAADVQRVINPLGAWHASSEQRGPP